MAWTENNKKKEKSNITTCTKTNENCLRDLK